ncbi:unnamed protein product [Amoebophrya sp. A25]|nr:unnamed protein product [Amoebophrya sp. A25]|eukprot:GSA25T00024434001.1
MEQREASSSSGTSTASCTSSCCTSSCCTSSCCTSSSCTSSSDRENETQTEYASGEARVNEIGAVSDIFRRILKRRLDVVFKGHYAPEDSIIEERPLTRLTGASLDPDRVTLTQQSAVYLKFDVSVQIELSHQLRKALNADEHFRRDFASVFRESYLEMLQKVDFRPWNSCRTMGNCNSTKRSSCCRIANTKRLHGQCQQACSKH